MHWVDAHAGGVHALGDALALLDRHTWRGHPLVWARAEAGALGLIGRIAQRRRVPPERIRIADYWQPSAPRR